MSDVDNFLARFGRKTTEYKFYNGEVTLRFDKDAHIYYLVQADGSLKALSSVSKICHIVDKSAALVPWACKQMMLKLFTLIPKTITKSGKEAVIMPYEDFEKAVHLAKTAHKDRLEDAGNVGNAVHDWVERYIALRIRGASTEEILSQFPFDSRAENGCTAALGWMAAHNVRWIATEKKIYSREHEIPGTMDGIARTDACDNPACCPVQFKDHLSVVDWKTSNNLYLEYIFQVATYEFAEREENGTEYDDAWIIRLGKDDGEFDPWHIDQEGLQLGWNAFRSALSLTRDIQALEEWQDRRKAILRAFKKVQKAEAKAVKLELECAGFKRYKGIRPPRCGCRACAIKYVDRKWLSTVFCLQLTAGDPNEVARVQVAESDAGSALLALPADSQHPGSTKPDVPSAHTSKLLGDLLRARNHTGQ